MFVSVDQGIGSTPFWRRVQYRLFGKELNYWQTPESRMLGFPTPPFEAALCGCAVVGAAMGGGLEWMNEHNCFMSEDLNLNSLVQQVKLALESDDEYLDGKAQAAFQVVSKFTRERAWTRLCELLEI
jgi:glycosyltransferase involved in cell wall biosynthesis